jgi:hypothetical protein
LPETALQTSKSQPFGFSHDVLAHSALIPNY